MVTLYRLLIRSRLSIGWQARLVVLAAIWDSGFTLIKIGDEVLDSIQVALGRLVLGTVTLSVITLVRRREHVLEDGR